jgi:hypothetical protein
MKKIILLLLLTFISLVGCNTKNESRAIYKRMSETRDRLLESLSSESHKISLEDKLNGYFDDIFDGNEILRSKRINEYFDMYLYFYGRTRGAIIEKCGTNYNNFKIIESEIDEYIINKYNQKEEMIYPDMIFTFYIDDDGDSNLLAYRVWKLGEKNYGNIFIGCDLDVIIKQLGKPNSFYSDNYGYIYKISYSIPDYFQIIFFLDINYKLKKFLCMKL